MLLKLTSTYFKPQCHRSNFFKKSLLMDLKIPCLVLLKMLNANFSMPMMLAQKWKLIGNNVSNKETLKKSLTLLYYSHVCTLFFLPTYQCTAVMPSRSILHLFFTWRIRNGFLCSCYLESTKVAGVRKGVQCHCCSLKAIFCFLNSVKGEAYFHYCTDVCFCW